MLSAILSDFNLLNKARWSTESNAFEKSISKQRTTCCLLTCQIFCNDDNNIANNISFWLNPVLGGIIN